MEFAAGDLREELQDEIANAQRQRKNLIRQASRAQRKRSSNAVTPGMIRSALTLYCFNNYVPDAAVDWLVQRRKSLNYGPATHESLLEAVENWFVSAYQEDIDNLMNPQTDSDEKRYSSLLLWYYKWTLKTWVFKKNATGGNAPNTEETMRELDIMHLMYEAPYYQRNDLSEIRNRTFAWHWRKHFEVVMLRRPTLLRHQAFNDSFQILRFLCRWL